METTLAGAAARHAEHQWKLHLSGCPRCTRAVRSRHWDDLCRSGGSVRAEQLELQRELRRQRELDRQPSPDQEMLF
jgi:hypothetical protein